jgi:hypothetical protein
VKGEEGKKKDSITWTGRKYEYEYAIKATPSPVKDQI